MGDSPEQPSLRVAGAVAVDGAVVSMLSAHDDVTDRHKIVVVIDSGAAVVLDGAGLETLCVVPPGNHRPTRVLCAKQSGVLFAAKSAATQSDDVVELAFADIPVLAAANAGERFSLLCSVHFCRC